MADEPGRRAVLGCGAACALSAACGKWIEEPLAIEAGDLSKNTISVPVSRVPELMKPGGSVILRVNASDATGRRIAVLVANTTSEGFRAYNAYCPHAQCELAWVDDQNQVICPCHLSRFSVSGQVEHGPARADIDSYSAKLSTDQQTLIVDLSGGGGVFPPSTNGEVRFTLDQMPSLTQIGASVTGHAQGVPYPLVVLRKSAGEMVAFDARCPHLGCAVTGAQSLFLCPCHGSIFDIDGAVKAEPATSPLRKLDTSFDGDLTVIQVPP